MSVRIIVLFVIPCCLFSLISANGFHDNGWPERHTFPKDGYFVESPVKLPPPVKNSKSDNKWKRTDCKTSRDCQPYEICDKGSCQCTKGNVRYIHECVPVKNYGEECSHDIQCNDERMICTNDEHDVRLKRFCRCDPYHIWNSTTVECVEIGDITHIAGNFREVYNVRSMIERTAQKVFLGVVIAGLIFVSILLSFIGICSVYGCCTKHKKGRYGEDDLGKSQVNDVAIVGLPSGTYEAIETDFSGMAAI